MNRVSTNHFSSGAADYDQFRPRYPETLFEHLASLLERRELAWDCATGTGQALGSLAPRFRMVVASDASLAQVAEARVPPNVRLFVASAERVPLPAASVDLVTVAQALHWFNLPAFFGEAGRVLRPDGILAAWTYNRFTINADIDAVVHAFYRETLGACWPPERRLVDEAYAGIAWPAGDVATRRLTMSQAWSCEHLLHYIGTWSAVKRYRKLRDADPLPAVTAALRRAWGGEPVREVVWPLTLTTVRPRG